MPFLIVCYFVAYLDRVNVSFAALTMNKDLGLSATAYGLGAGIFFLSYFLFEVPSNLVLERFGARRWIARIMFTWGLSRAPWRSSAGANELLRRCACCSGGGGGILPRHHLLPDAVVPVGLPGPDHRLVHGGDSAVDRDRRARSGLLLGLDGFVGLKGWQWLFILEAVPALILAVVVFFYLTDRPADATWLQPDERDWLVARLAGASAQREAVARLRRDAGAAESEGAGARAWCISAPWRLNYGLSFFLPQIVKAFGLSNVRAGFVSAIPYVDGVDRHGVVWPGRSDRHMRAQGAMRRWRSRWRRSASGCRRCSPIRR